MNRTIDLTKEHDPRAAAAALVPEFDRNPVPSKGLRHRSITWLSVAATLSLVAGLFYAAFAYHAWALGRHARLATPVTAVTPTDATTYSSFANTALGYAVAPVALTYHDIGPNLQNSQYVVSPAAFEAQMQMLSRAGYRTLTADQFVAYQQGTFHPTGRTVLITFDDGTQGLWTYADKILARYHFHAVSFVITGRVSTHRPYYLTWPEVKTMARSGRWDFESHTHNLHSQVPTEADGVMRPNLANRLHLPDGTAETTTAFTARVTTDLKASKADLVAHGLPSPQLFAWPYSDVSAKIPDPVTAAITEHLVEGMFGANFTDVGRDPQPVSRRVVANQLIERFELTRTSTASQAFQQLAAMQTLPPAQAAHPLAIDTHWYEEGGHPAPVDTTDTSVTPDASSLRYVKMTWAPQRTADWDDYTVSATVTGLEASSGGTGGLRVRADSSAELLLRVSDHQATITDAAGTTLGRFPIAALGAHKLTATVAAAYTRFSVDGTVLLQVPSAGGPTTTGGFGFATQRSSTSLPFVSYTDVRVSAL